MTDYTRIAERARAHTPLVPCIACRQAAWIAKYVRRGAVLPTIGCTCIPTHERLQLIADVAADLLAALEAIRECTFLDRTQLVSTPCQDCIDAVDAAIAKAEASL